VVGHHTFGSGDNSIAKTVANTRELRYIAVDTKTRAANALDALDCRNAVRVTEENLENSLLAIFNDDELLNETFSCRTRAISRFWLLAGMSTTGAFAATALRMRVSISAIVSVAIC